MTNPPFHARGHTPGLLARTKVAPNQEEMTMAKNLAAHEVKARDDVQALMDAHSINWGNLLKILQTLLGVLGPILGGLGGGTTPPVSPP